MDQLRLVEVGSRKETRDFVELPLRLYKGNPYFIPPLYGDEVKAVKHKTPYEDVTESKCFLVYRGKEAVGRIQGIIQKQYNERNVQKRIRFTRFDCIDDPEVAKMLFGAVEEYGRSNGMDTICGPLGYSDFEREGMLIDGFDQVATFEEAYNFPYYQKLTEDLGFVKEVDWYESYVQLPDNLDEMLSKMKRIRDRALKDSGVHVSDRTLPMKEVFRRYQDGFFDIIDKAYYELYGVVPFTPKTRDMVIKQFLPILDSRDIVFLLNEKDEVVGTGLMFPSIGEAIQKSGGRLTPFALIRLLKALKKPKVFDFGLVALDPSLQNSGLAAVMIYEIMIMMKEAGIEHCETNLNLEDNVKIRALWKYFKAHEHKKRRSFIKPIQ